MRYLDNICIKCSVIIMSMMGGAMIGEYFCGYNGTVVGVFIGGIVGLIASLKNN